MHVKFYINEATPVTLTICPPYKGMCINRLFPFCKVGKFNIHIWAWFSYFICYLYFGKELISFLGSAKMCAYYENPNRIHTELTFIKP